MIENLNDKNFLLYCAKHYQNQQCHSTDEFFEDVRRIKYIKKLITRYVEKGILVERLILNHMIVLSNVFEPEILCRILYLKAKSQFKYIKPFLVLLGGMVETIHNVGDEIIIDVSTIPMDQHLIKILRKI